MTKRLMSMATAQRATMMAVDDDDNEVNGDGATSDDDGDGTMGEDNDG